IRLLSQPTSKRWLLYVILPYIFLISNNIIPKHIQSTPPHLPFVRHIDFYQAFEQYKNNHFVYTVPRRKWRNELKVVVEDAELCKPTPELLLVVMVNESERTLRDNIRMSWGNASRFSECGLPARLVFVFGVGHIHPHSTSRDQVTDELTEHHDLIQFDYLESNWANRSTKKVAAILNHLTKHCSASRFVAIIDEDFMVNPRNLVQQLHAVTAIQYPIHISGYTLNNIPVDLAVKKDRSPHHEVLVHTMIPRFVVRGFILMSMPVAKLLAFGMPLMPYISEYDRAIGATLLNFRISPTDMNGIHIHGNTQKLRSDQLIRLVAWYEHPDIGLWHNRWSSLAKPCNDAISNTKSTSDSKTKF
ncbi:beta-1 3-galactosyltransferase 2, partial [Clonorchis sinensis]